MLSPDGTADTRGYLVPTELHFRQNMHKLNSSIKSLPHLLFYFLCKNYQQHCEQILVSRRKLQSNHHVTRTIAFPLTRQGSGEVCGAFPLSCRTSQCSAIPIQQFHVEQTQGISALQGCTCESSSQMDAPGNKAHGT